MAIVTRQRPQSDEGDVVRAGVLADRPRVIEGGDIPRIVAPGHHGETEPVVRAIPPALRPDARNLPGHRLGRANQRGTPGAGRREVHDHGVDRDIDPLQRPQQGERLRREALSRVHDLQGHGDRDTEIPVHGL